jgi:hypothetical protein
MNARRPSLLAALAVVGLLAWAGAVEAPSIAGAAPAVPAAQGPIQVPGPIQTVGPFPTVAPARLPAASAELPELVPLPDLASAAPAVIALPPEAACVTGAALRPTGRFTGYSFEVDVPAIGGSCLVPAGLVFRSLDGRQDMLVMATQPFDPGASTVRVYANCLDASKPGPRPGAPYALGELVTADSDLGRLVWTLPDVPPDAVTEVGLQAAVWAITNNLSAAGLRRIFPAMTAEDLASARLLLQRAGVDPAGRALFGG